ncbi:MAG: hypothetical protein Q4D16_21960 [Eubacteriales bacterium]|nr:hypothetical protein [Eubacteriales bacterium]
MSKKSNLKSVRISDEVMEYIFSCEGDGFNQKFENIVLFCKSEEDRKRRICASLDEEIEDKYKHLDSLRQLSSRSRMAASLLDQLNTQLSQLVDAMDSLGFIPPGPNDLPFG